MKYLVTVLRILNDAPPKAIAAWTEDNEQAASDAATVTVLHGYGDADGDEIAVNVVPVRVE